MRLSDIMGAAGYSVYAEVALVVFFLAFIALAAYLYFTRGAPHWEAARRLPLESDATPETESTEGDRS